MKNSNGFHQYLALPLHVRLRCIKRAKVNFHSYRLRDTFSLLDILDYAYQTQPSITD